MHTNTQYDEIVAAWEETQATPPLDSRIAPAWVERPMRGSTGRGNGGWAALGLTGGDLASDLLIEVPEPFDCYLV